MMITEMQTKQFIARVSKLERTRWNGYCEGRLRSDSKIFPQHYFSQLKKKTNEVIRYENLKFKSFLKVKSLRSYKQRNNTSWNILIDRFFMVRQSEAKRDIIAGWGRKKGEEENLLGKVLTLSNFLKFSTWMWILNFKRWRTLLFDEGNYSVVKYVSLPIKLEVVRRLCEAWAGHSSLEKLSWNIKWWQNFSS